VIDHSGYEHACYPCSVFLDITMCVSVGIRWLQSDWPAGPPAGRRAGAAGPPAGRRAGAAGPGAAWLGSPCGTHSLLLYFHLRLPRRGLASVSPLFLHDDESVVLISLHTRHNDRRNKRWYTDERNTRKQKKNFYCVDASLRFRYRWSSWNRARPATTSSPDGMNKGSAVAPRRRFFIFILFMVVYLFVMKQFKRAVIIIIVFNNYYCVQ